MSFFFPTWFNSFFLSFLQIPPKLDKINKTDFLHQRKKRFWKKTFSGLKTEIKIKLDEIRILANGKGCRTEENAQLATFHFSDLTVAVKRRNEGRACHTIVAKLWRAKEKRIFTRWQKYLPAIFRFCFFKLGHSWALFPNSSLFNS